MTNTTAKKRFGLMGTFGFGNLGDAAIQEAMIQNIRKRYPEAEIFGFSLNPEDTEKRHGIPSFPITRMSWQEESQRGILQRLSTKTQSHANPLIRKLSRWILRLPIEFGLARNAFNDLKHVDILILSGVVQLKITGVAGVADPGVIPIPSSSLRCYANYGASNLLLLVWEQVR